MAMIRPNCYLPGRERYHNIGTMRKLFHVEQSFFLLVPAMAADWWFGVLGLVVRLGFIRTNCRHLIYRRMMYWIGELFHVEQFGVPGSASPNLRYEAFQSK